MVHKAYEQLGVVVIAVEMYSKGGCESPLALFHPQCAARGHRTPARAPRPVRVAPYSTPTGRSRPPASGASARKLAHFAPRG